MFVNRKIEIMKTKLHLLLAFFLLCSVASAQDQDKQVANSITRNMLVYQMMNDFSTIVPAFFVVPGWFVFSSFQVTHVPVFVDEAYYSTARVKSPKDALHKELYELMDIDFFPEIPDDKQMEVRVTDQSRLLYKLRFYRDADTLVVLQISGKNQDEKRFRIAEGELFQILKNEKSGQSYRKSVFIGDSLQKIRDYDSKKNRLQVTEIRFIDNQIDTKSTFRKRSQGKLKLITKEKYIYLDKLLSTIEKSNRKGYVRETTSYIHNLDNKIVSMSKKNLQESLEVSYVYNNEGFMSKKAIKSGNLIYSVQYYHDNGKTNGFLIDGLNGYYNDELILEMNLKNQLSSIQHNKVYNRIPPMVKTEEILFDYHTNGNIESIRIYDIQGRITKHIDFEYVYFNL